ncbi:MAG TPA: FAD-binding domain-containing protein, partial [Saprospiraceae bacterium]|nr:FAD-binding domain-containing protein [Saprospiraceae bacterium]
YQGKDRNFYKKKVVEDLMIRDYLRLLGKKFGDVIFQKHGMTPNEDLRYNNDSSLIKEMLAGNTEDALFNACLNQLKQTGFLPGFARIYFARYIIDEFEMDWRVGAELFESYLIDYDPCSNWCNWQILAGQGPEGLSEQRPSLEYLRKKLDPKQLYTEKWSSSTPSSVE